MMFIKTLKLAGKLCLLLICFALSVTCVNAIEMQNLYTAQVEVEAQNFQQRQLAYKKAIETIFIRVSGQSDIIDKPEIKQAISQPTKYLSQYQFEHQGGQLLLKAQFNEKAINGLIKSVGETIWGARRPQLVWWLAIEEDNKRKIISDADIQFTESVLAQSQVRGLASLIPLVDFDDLMQISITDIWGRFEEPVTQASQRYDAEAIVVGKVFKPYSQDSVTSQAWFAEVSLIEGMQSNTFTLSSENLAELKLKIVDRIADALAQKYAIKATQFSTQSLLLTVENIHNAAEALLIQNFLASISAVESVKIHQLDTAGVGYQLKLLGEAVDVYDALAFDNRIEKVKHKFSQEKPIKENLYRWKG